MIHHQKTLPNVNDAEREVHPSWLFNELIASNLTFTCQNNFRERALNELSKSGEFIFSLPTPNPYAALHTSSYAELFARTLDFVNHLKEQSGVFLISTGPAIFDAVANQLLGATRFSNRAHQSLDFYLLDRDVGSFLNCFNDLGICGSTNLIIKDQQIQFERSKDSDFKNGKVSLIFQSDLFIKVINFYLVEETPRGYLFNFEDNDFIYPEKHLCEPELQIKTSMDQSLTGIPLIKFPIANFIANSQERYWTDADRKNISLMHAYLHAND